MVNMGFSQVVDFATKGENFLDLVFCDHPNLICNILPGPHFLVVMILLTSQFSSLFNYLALSLQSIRFWIFQNLIVPCVLSI